MSYEGIPSSNKRKFPYDKPSDGKEMTWNELKKQKKEQNKKWKEKKLLKKLEKQKLKESEDQVAQTTKITSDTTNSKGRNYTVSIAIPGSILDNAQSFALRTYLAGQIARAASIFSVNEIIVYGGENQDKKLETSDEFSGVKKQGKACEVMSCILQFLECPQYLRKYFFPLHPDLKYAGVLNPLDSPHHVRSNDEIAFREGCTLPDKLPSGKGTYVDVGLRKPVRVEKELEPNLRVTVRMISSYSSKKLKGEVVSPNVPCEESDLYWGYEVRIAETFESVFAKCPYKDGYDLTVGTSDKGSPVDDVTLPRFKHMLIVFGGLEGLETYIEEDEQLTVDDPESLFNYYLNTCPSQGSRTIRTEEAILVSLSSLRKKILDCQK